MGSEGGSAGIANESKPAGGRKGKGRNEKPRTARTDRKKKKKEKLQFKLELASLLSAKAEKSHKVQITKRIPRLLSCTEEDKIFHTISELSGD